MNHLNTHGSSWPTFKDSYLLDELRPAPAAHLPAPRAEEVAVVGEEREHGAFMS